MPPSRTALCPRPSSPGMRQVFQIELVHALDYSLHEFACWGVVGVLGNGDHPDTSSPEHGLEEDGVLALAGEADLDEQVIEFLQLDGAKLAGTCTPWQPDWFSRRYIVERWARRCTSSAISGVTADCPAMI